MPQQVLHRQAAGLIANRNPLFAEEGSLTLAENVVIDREGVMSPRRGFSRYATADAKAIGEFRGRLVVLDGTTLKMDDGTGVLTSLGTFSAPAGARMKFAEVDKSLYFTSSQGIQKLDVPPESGGIVRRAGMPPGLDTQTTLVAGTWFTNNKQVAYRVLWVRVDLNGRVVSSSPSWRVIVTNTSGVAKAITLTSTIPPDVIAGDFYEVYRTELSADQNTSPGDETFRLARISVSATDITNRYVTFSDTYDPIYLGQPLSTNASEDGILQAHDRPPYAQDLALWKGYLHFMGDLRREPRLELQFLDISGITDEVDTITISRSDTTLIYKFSAAEDIPTRKFKRETGLTLSQNIRSTMESFLKVLNRDPGNSSFLGFYTSEEDDPPGMVLIRDRSMNVDPFTVTTTVGAKFSPSVPSVGLKAEPFKFSNRVAWARFQEPDHAPEQNRTDIGSTAAILRGLALTTSFIIIKEDGVWRRTGYVEAEFTDLPLDPSLRMVCPDSAVVLDNQVYCASLQGLVRVADAGAAIISWPIDIALKRIFSFSNYKTISFAVEYQSDFKYIFFTQEFGSDTYSRIGWVWNHLTNRWTIWRKDAACGRVLSSLDNLFMGHAADGQILKERKSWNTSLEDFRDESIPITITQTSPNIEFTYIYSEPLAAGFRLEQPTTFSDSAILTVTALGGDSYRVTVEDAIPGLVIGAAFVALPIKSEVRWKPEVAGNPSALKHWLTTQYQFEDEGARHFSYGFASDLKGEIGWYTRILDEATSGWGFGEWGDFSWGDHDLQKAPVLRAMVPTDYERGRMLVATLKHSWAKERWSLLDLAFTFEITGELTAVR